MGFLDNTGDIIIDAVLTDTGRMRLAKGDGSFKIAKFALGDDEIDYTLFNKSHASGSAYYDLEILKMFQLHNAGTPLLNFPEKLEEYLNTIKNKGQLELKF